MSGDEPMHTPDEWAPPAPKGPHDHKGHSEEKCVRCGWVMGHQPLNCQNNDTPHVFPSQLDEVERLRAAGYGLAKCVNQFGDIDNWTHDDGFLFHDEALAAIAAWEEARREQ